MSITRRRFFNRLAAALPLAALGSARTPSKPADGSVPRRRFGRHDELVSVVGIGGHTLADAKSVREARRIAHRAVDLGINFFDNAWDYHDGRAEEWMGDALKGVRDRTFLMTKVCTHHLPLPDGGREGAMRMLETSLKRLKTDHLDLWMVHQLDSEAQVDKAYGPDGVLEALDLAKKQGKIRYTGFTGHKSADIHLKMIRGNYPFDACLMPVSAVGTLRSRDFEREVMPELTARQIAVLGMKGFGGSWRVGRNKNMTAEKVLGYSLSYPGVCTHLVGIDKMEFLEAAALASAKTPMTDEERTAFAKACDEDNLAQYARYLSDPTYRDGQSSSRPA